MIAHGWKVGGERVTEVIDTSACKILPVWEPYASRVVAGEKTWELRPNASVHVGRVYIAVAARKRDKERAGAGASRLIPKGIRYLVGSVEVKGTRTVNEREFTEGQNRHCFDEATSGTETKFDAARRMAGGRSGQLYAWEMEDATWYEWPVPFKASPAVRWPVMATPGGAAWSDVQRAARGEGAWATGRRPRRRGRPVTVEEDGEVDSRAGADDGRRERERRVQARVDYNPGVRRAGVRRGKKRQRADGTEDAQAGTKRRQATLTPAHVVVSPLTVTRMVGGRYDWLDGALAKRRRRLAPDDGRIHDPG